MKKETVRAGSSVEKITHFAAVNSGRGFVSFYGEVFGDKSIVRRYIIKGGPGTGKSSFMREVASHAEGRGLTVEYFRCSSDPDSLDGIIIDGRIALLDGTAPHTFEPELVGARDEIVDLGQFWDSDKLYARYNDIAALSALKREAYTKAYRFLSAAMNVDGICASLCLPSLKHDKMRAAVCRIMRYIPDGDGYRVRYGLVNSIGMKGRVYLDTYERVAKKLYAVYDSYGLGTYFLQAVIDEARKKGLEIQVSYRPLMPDQPDAVLLIGSGVAFVLSENGELECDVRINMRRFIDTETIGKIKSEYRIDRHLYDALLQSATESLVDAGGYHFELEKIYISCMDFDSEKKFIESFCRRIL